MSRLLLLLLVCMPFATAVVAQTAPAPDANEVRRILNDLQLFGRPHLEVTELSIDAEATGGNAVYPQLMQRFSGVVRTNADLFALSETLQVVAYPEPQLRSPDDVDIVSIVTPAGETFPLHGVINWDFSAGRWEVFRQGISIENLAQIDRAGSPLARVMRSPRSVVAGSPEEAEVRGRIAALRAEADAEILGITAVRWRGLSICGSTVLDTMLTLEPGEDVRRATGHIRTVAYGPEISSSPAEAIVEAQYHVRSSTLTVEMRDWISETPGIRRTRLTLKPEDGNLVGTAGFVQVGLSFNDGCSARLEPAEAFEARQEAAVAPLRALLPRVPVGEMLSGEQTGPDLDGRQVWPVSFRIDAIDERSLRGIVRMAAVPTVSTLRVGEIELDFFGIFFEGGEKIQILFNNTPRNGISIAYVRMPFERTRQCRNLTARLDTTSGVLHLEQEGGEWCLRSLSVPLAVGAD